MRYYDIQVGAPGFSPGWSSHPGGVADPGAQEVLLNLDVFKANSDDDNSVTVSDNSTVEIKGVSWDQVRTSNQLVNKPITIYGGMKPGLPLASYQASHSGLLMTGIIQKAWGNWVGTEMSIQMALAASVTGPSGGNGGGNGGGGGSAGGGGGASAGGSSFQVTRFSRSGPRSLGSRALPRGLSQGIARGEFRPGVALAPGQFDSGSFSPGAIAAFTDVAISELNAGAASVDLGNGIVSSFVSGGFPGLTQPINMIHNMLPNMPLSSAITQTLGTAFPGMGLNVAISPLLKLAYQDAGVYQNIQQYATYLYKLSRSILGTQNYWGVHTSALNNTVYLSDRTQPTGSTTITAQDLVGQPTWIDLINVEIHCVMRADIKPYSTVTIPAGTLMVSTGAAILPYSSNQQRTTVTLEAKTFFVYEIQHVGDFRNPDGNYWITIIRATDLSGGSIDTSAPVQTTAPLQSVIPNQPTTGGQILPFGSVVKRSVRKFNA
jgi:hypothetical protein